MSKERFFEMHIPKRDVRQFTQEELDRCKGKLPDDTIEFLKDAGISTFGSDFFWTVLPDDYYSMLEGWGLQKQGIDPKKCHVFLRTSFGTLIYYHEARYYSLNPFSGTNMLCGRVLYKVMITVLTEETYLDVFFWQGLHKKVRDEVPQLQEDEIYTIVPSIPEGGSPETSKVEVVKMQEHLARLSELFGHKVTED